MSEQDPDERETLRVLHQPSTVMVGSPDEFRDRAWEALGLGRPIYTDPEILEKSGADRDFADRLWRAMGFALPPDDELVYAEADLDTLRTVVAFIEQGFADPDLVVSLTRVLSQSLSRVADAEAAAIKDFLAALDSDPDEFSLENASAVLATLEKFLVYVWRRHMAVALDRQSVIAGDMSPDKMTVGFADLVGFTKLSRQLDDPELTGIVDRLESRSQDMISDLGGRVVKTIGDEVMFVAQDPNAAADLGLRLVEACATDDDLPDMRVGLAHGPVIAHRGDYLGATVNLASRAAETAFPGTVLVSDEMEIAVGGSDRFYLKPLRRRHLKGIGPTRLWVLRPSG